MLLLVPLMLANYALAKHIVPVGGRRRTAARGLLIAGVSGNLAVLAYFKYANFFVDNLNISFGIEFRLGETFRTGEVTFTTNVALTQAHLRFRCSGLLPVIA
ncbi:MAG TPA: hypothetical protein VFH21_07715 [Burkholderiales bacterium]|nr:hypothetical protein [Burkholderiales bacterium]